MLSLARSFVAKQKGPSGSRAELSKLPLRLPLFAASRSAFYGETRGSTFFVRI
jgi:hypothetical protein